MDLLVMTAKRKIKRVEKKKVEERMEEKILKNKGEP